jgi:hypothetical protein
MKGLLLSTRRRLPPLVFNTAVLDAPVVAAAAAQLVTPPLALVSLPSTKSFLFW